MPADDVFVNLITETKKSVGNLVKYAAAITGAMVIVKKMLTVVKNLEAAFFIQEKAETRLNAAIRATGRESSISVVKLKELASGLQAVTTFGDEATLSAIAMVQQLANLNQEGLEKVTPAMLDFAAAMDVDLQTAATLIGKTLGSTTNALSRYGIEIDAQAEPTEKLIALTEAMDSKFKGMAVSMGENALGASIKLKNVMGDLQEVIGQKFAEALKKSRTALAAFVGEIVEAISTANALIAAEKATAEGASTLADEILLAAEAVDMATEAMEKAKAITLEAEAFYGAMSIQAGDLREAEQKLVDVLQAKKDHLEALEFTQKAEIKAAEESGKKTDEASQASKDYMRILAELRAELGRVTERENFLGDAYDETKAKSEAMLGAIDELIELGYKVENKNIRDLLLLYGDLIAVREEAADVTAAAPSKAKPGLLKLFEQAGPKRGPLGATSNFILQQLKTTEQEEKKILRAMGDEYTSWTDTKIQNDARWLKQQEENRKAAEKETVKLQAAYLRTGDAILGYMDTAFTGMAKSMGASEREMFQIHKLFAAARATVNVIEATSKALTIHPLLGIAVGLAGAASVGAILAEAPPAFGKGAIVRRPTMALIGERGPEAVVPLGAGGALGSTNITMHVYGTVQSETQLAGFVASVMARARRGH